MADNKITIHGTATRDPELRYTSGGRGVASLGVAVNKRYMKDGEWTEGPTSFFNVTAWGALGEHAAECITKGTRVIVTGEMQQRSYETQEGEKRTVWDLNADDLGPSLKWATATVVKADRTTPSSGSGAPSGPVFGDEEPF
jgi:single-strand DNA-binding protein